jgi:hypothetical protein
MNQTKGLFMRENTVNYFLYQMLISLGESVNDILEQSKFNQINNYTLESIQLNFLTENKVSVLLYVMPPKTRKAKGKLIKSTKTNIYFNDLIVQKVFSLYEITKKSEIGIASSHIIQSYLDSNFSTNIIQFNHNQSVQQNMKTLLIDTFFAIYEKQALEKTIETNSKNDKKVKI